MQIKSTSYLKKKFLQRYTNITKFFYRCASYDIKKKSYYEILGISKNATEDEIKRAFFEKSRELHPDGDLYKNNIDNDSQDKSHWSSKSKTQSFMELKDAYDVLRRSDKRAEYDDQLSDLESTNGYLMECNSKNKFKGNLFSKSMHTGAPSFRGGMENTDGHFFDPVKQYETEEKNKKYFKHGITIVLVFIFANMLYVSFLRKKKLILDEAKNRRSVGRNGVWRSIRFFNYTPHKSYYEILGVSPNATKNEIKEKFYELSRKYHPDAVNGVNKDENSKKYREISQAYETLKNDQKRAAYDSSRNFGNGINMNNQFWQHHDFSQYQNPNGGYRYQSETFYYGPDGKTYKKSSSRYSKEDLEDIWRRFNKQMNTDSYKEYEKYQEYMRNTLWKEYQTRREESWKKQREQFEKGNQDFYIFSKKGKQKYSSNIKIDENMLAKIAGVYIFIFFCFTIFQIILEKNVLKSKGIINVDGTIKQNYMNEEMYNPASIKNIPNNVDIPSTPPDVSSSMYPYGLPK